MRDIWAAQQLLVPELVQTFKRRQLLLKHISALQPIGRRGLAERLGLNERAVRADADFLKEQKLIVSDANGMSLSPLGQDLLWRLAEIDVGAGIFVDLQQQLRAKLGIREVLVVAGDSSVDEAVKLDMGRAAAAYLVKLLQPTSKVAVTGGSSLLALAQTVRTREKYSQVLVLPARGGLGERMEFQANLIAAQLAEALGGTYKLLHVPDHMNEVTREALLQDPYIQEVLDLITGVDIVIHGIGNGLVMAKQRHESQATMQVLAKQAVVGEALGYYFDLEGNILTSGSSLGIPWEKLMQVPQLIAVAGGSAKAKAIWSVLRQKTQHVLITDEAAAKAILNKEGDVNDGN